MKRTDLLSLLSLIVLYLGPVGTAISQSYTWEPYSAQNGLPQNSAKFILKDPNGYTWIATEEGLVKYNGTTFRVYNQDNCSVLKSNRILQLYYGIDSSIYVGAVNTAILKINAKSQPEELLRKEFFLSRKSRFVDLSPYAIKSTGNKYGINRQQLKNLYDGGVDENHAWAQSVSDTSLYLIDTTYVNYVTSQTFSYAAISTRPQWCFFLHDSLFTLNTDNTYTLWHNGMPVKKNIQLVASPGGSRIANHYTVYLNQSSGHSFFVSDNIIYRAEYVNNSIRLQYCCAVAKDFPIASLYYDPATMQFFVGSKSNGMLIGRPAHFTLMGNSSLTPPAVNIYSQVEVEDGKIVTSSMYTFSKNKIEAAIGFDAGISFGFFKDRDSSIWYNNNGRLIRSRPFLHPLQSWALPTDMRFQHLFHSRHDGKLYVLTNGSVGYIADTAIHWFYKGAIPGNPGEYYTGFDHYSPDTMIISTSAGIYVYTYSREKFEKVADFPVIETRSLLFDDGLKGYWITSYGNGFYFWKPGRPPVKFPMDKNRRLNTSHYLLQDRYGRVWIPTNRGLFVTTHSSLAAFLKDSTQSPYYIYYSEKDGLGNNEFNGGGFYPGITLGNGTISLPHMQGLIWFDPASVVLQTPSAAIFLESVKINSKELPLADSVIVPTGYRQIELFISSPYFLNNENQVIEYRFGNDEPWFEVTNNKVTLTGQYKFSSPFLKEHYYL